MSYPTCTCPIQLCEALLGENISEDSVFFLLDVVTKYDCQELEKRCGNYLARYFDEIWESNKPSLLSLRPTTWVAMLASDELFVKYCQLPYTL